MGEDTIVPSINRENEVTQLTLAAGDIVRFGESLPDLRIRNGTRGTVESIHREPSGETMLRFALDDGRRLVQPWMAFSRAPRFGKPQPPRVVHAYAGTAYSAQGRTAAATVHYIGSNTDARETYVALTRHRSDVRIVVERDRIDAMCRQRQADPRIAPTISSIEERLFKEASQYSEKANVVDYVADRQAFVETGNVVNHKEQVRTRSYRLIHAARILRNALRFLSGMNALVDRWRQQDPNRAKRTMSELRTIVTKVRRFDDKDIDRSKRKAPGKNIER